MTAPQRFRRYARVLFAASAMILAIATADAAVRYVTQEGGAETKDGESWTTAYDEVAFPAAILSAGAGDEIWVKAGVYRPVIPIDLANITAPEQGKSFVLKDGAAVYGGFKGTETSSADRDPAANLTVLTGDLDDNDEGKVDGVTVNAYQIRGKNSKCVVTAGSGCGPTAVLDGFTVTAGNNDDKGGGMGNNVSGPTVMNCAFSGNAATFYGGGMYNYYGSSPTVTNCTFSGNGADDGGGMCNGSSSNPTVTNCIFWNLSGGEFYNDSAPIVRYCVVQGGYAGGTNIVSDDPKLGPLAWNGGPTQTQALLPGSSAIDAASPDIAPGADQRGVARPQGASYDIGAYEHWGKKILTVHVEYVGIAGNGSVTRAPSGDIFGTTGRSRSYDDNTPVLLTAVEESRDWFATWSGDASGTTATASVTMSCDRFVEAVFDEAWIVTVSAGAGGDIVASVPGAGGSGTSAPGDRGVSGTTTVKVRNGADQTFTVTPDAGYSIGSVLVDNVIVILGAGSKYTFMNVSADHAIEATFTANPTPTATPTPITTPTMTPTTTPTPVPTPDPDIPLPKVTLTITLYAGGTVVAGPIDVTDPATLASLLSSQTLLAQLLTTDPDAILSGNYNMDLIRFFSLLADLDDGVLDFTILFEVTVDDVPSGYRAQLFMLTRTFDAKGYPTGYAIVPRDEGESVFHKGSGARGWTETWRVTIRDGGVADGDARQDGSVAPEIAAVVAVFPQTSPTVTATPTQGSTGSGGGYAIPASGGAAFAALLLLVPVLISRKR